MKKLIPRRKLIVFPSFKKKLFNYILSKKFRQNNFRQKFQKKFSSYLGSNNNLLLLDKGRMGIEIILKNLNLRKDDEIILPNYYLKELESIIKKYCDNIKYVDISMATFSLDLNKLKNALNKNTKVVLISHLFGNCLNMDKLLKIVKKKGIILIEDCAHSFGSKYKNNHLGLFGDFSIFSFDYIKPLNLLGGGALLVNNDKFKPIIKKNANLLEVPKFSVFKKVLYFYFQKLLLSRSLFPITRFMIENDFFNFLVKRIHKNDSYSNICRLSNFQSMIGFYSLDYFEEKQIILKNKYKFLIKNLNENSRKFLQKFNNEKQSFYFLIYVSPLTIKETKSILKQEKIDFGSKNFVMDIMDNSLDYQNSLYIYNHAIQLPFYLDIKEEELCRIAKTLNYLSSQKIR